ncbi:MAG: AraC family transcriptional regulator [Dongiaceae bacterium]
MTVAQRMIGNGELHLAQEDGGSPATLAAGTAPGESGVSVLKMRFQGAAHYRATPSQHLVWFQLSPQTRFDCRIAGHALRHDPPVGSLSICPAGVDSAADAEEGIEALLVAIRPGQLALAAAEDSALEAQLMVRFSGRDPTLLELARTLALESAGRYPNGALFWNEIASGFLDRLLARHMSGFDGRARGSLGKDVLDRLRSYVMDNLDHPIEVATLAKMAGRSPFHFTRVFTRSVGVTPHRYIVHLRLRRAIELVRDERSGLAEIAARTGFADQSHLSRWVRRVHGVSVTQLVA